ncbi:MAG: histidine phosphatase family protein [Chloroflexi bacterium]|nr:histidine phosphatase family protein [Chloroflexota bacterium]
MSVDIVFETHSISVDNERGVATGWLDGCLSERGRLLAKELGERRRRERIDAIFTSDLGRAVETATIAFGDDSIPIILDKRLRECNYGMLNGMPTAQLETERSQHIDVPFPEGESYRDVVMRVQEFLQDLSRDWDGKSVVIIGHSATRWALEHLLYGQALPDLVNAPFTWQEGWHYTLGQSSSNSRG